MHWSQQAHDNGAILDLLPNHKGAIRPGQQIGHKTHDDVESDICHTEALNQRLLGGVKDSLPEIESISNANTRMRWVTPWVDSKNTGTSSVSIRNIKVDLSGTLLRCV